jgi:hypothetical protein
MTWIRFVVSTEQSHNTVPTHHFSVHENDEMKTDMQITKIAEHKMTQQSVSLLATISKQIEK